VPYEEMFGPAPMSVTLRPVFQDIVYRADDTRAQRWTFAARMLRMLHLLTILALSVGFYALLSRLAPVPYLIAISAAVLGITGVFSYFCTFGMDYRKRALAFSSGVIPYFLAIVAMIVLSAWVPWWLQLVLIAPAVEEIVKASTAAVALRSVTWKTGIVLGAGFAFFESTSYLVFFQSIDNLYFMRFPSIAVHAAATALSCHGIAVKKPVRYLCAAILLHMAHNGLYPLLAYLWSTWTL